MCTNDHNQGSDSTQVHGMGSRRCCCPVDVGRRFELRSNNPLQARSMVRVVLCNKRIVILLHHMDIGPKSIGSGLLPGFAPCRMFAPCCSMIDNACKQRRGGGGEGSGCWMSRTVPPEEQLAHEPPMPGTAASQRMNCALSGGNRPRLLRDDPVARLGTSSSAG